MVRGRGGTPAATIAAKVGANHREAASQQGRDGAPHQMGLRKPMQQQDSRTGPETAQKNTRFLHLHVKSSKILERLGFVIALSASIILQRSRISHSALE